MPVFSEIKFNSCKEGLKESEEIKKDIMNYVSEEGGAILKPERILFTSKLPKTRSGKIMRRVLKGYACGEDIGDISTLDE